MLAVGLPGMFLLPTGKAVATWYVLSLALPISTVIMAGGFFRTSGRNAREFRRVARVIHSPPLYPWRMAKEMVVVILGDIQIDSQVAGAEHEQAVGSIACRILSAGGSVVETSCKFKQTTGTAFSEEFNLEVERPLGYRGALDWQKYSDACTEHVRKAVSNRGSGIFIDEQAKGAVIMDVVLAGFQTVIEFEVASPSGGPW